MKVLWIGSYATEEVNNELQKIGYTNASQYVAQRNLVEGLEDAYKHKFDAIGGAVFPDNSKIKKIETIDFSDNQNVRKLIGYKNKKYINRVYLSKNLNKEVKKYLINNKNEIIDVFFYEMRSMCLNCAKLIKKFNKNIRTHLIVPDLPAYMSGSYSFVKKTLKKIDYCGIKNKLKFIDDFILFASPMAEYLGIQNKRWMVYEGSINVNDINKFDCDNGVSNGQVNILYSGMIDKSYGIFNLVEAVKGLDGVKLFITGDGDDASLLQLQTKNCNKVQYLGYLPSRKDLLDLQGKMDFLINMRDPEVVATNYFFPSKLFEYMLTGKPVISCKLGGIPIEYYDYLLIIEDIKVDTIKNKLLDLLKVDKGELIALGKKAKKFIVANKTNVQQARKIKEFISLYE